MADIGADAHNAGGQHFFERDGQIDKRDRQDRDGLGEEDARDRGNDDVEQAPDNADKGADTERVSGL